MLIALMFTRQNCHQTPCFAALHASFVHFASIILLADKKKKKKQTSNSDASSRLPVLVAVTGRITGTKTAWVNLAICLCVQYGMIDALPAEPSCCVCVCVCLCSPVCCLDADISRCENWFSCSLVISVNNQIMMQKRKLNLWFTHGKKNITPAEY